MSLRTFIIIAAIVIVVAILAINWRTWFPKPGNPVAAAAAKEALPPVAIDGGVIGSRNGNGTRGLTANSLNSTLILMQGSKGNEVIELQTLMNQANPSALLVADGIFGNATRKQLQALTGRQAITLEQAWTFFVKGYKSDYENSKKNFSILGLNF